MVQMGQPEPWKLKTWAIANFGTNAEPGGNRFNAGAWSWGGEMRGIILKGVGSAGLQMSITLTSYCLSVEAGDQPGLSTGVQTGEGTWEAGCSALPRTVIESTEFKRRARQSWLFHWTTNKLNFGYGAVNWHSAVLGTVGGVYEVAQQGQALGECCFESAWTSCEPAVGFPPQTPGARAPWTAVTTAAGTARPWEWMAWAACRTCPTWVVAGECNQSLTFGQIFFKKQKNKKLSLTVLQYKLVIYALL